MFVFENHDLELNRFSTRFVCSEFKLMSKHVKKNTMPLWSTLISVTHKYMVGSVKIKRMGRDKSFHIYTYICMKERSGDFFIWNEGMFQCKQCKIVSYKY